MLAHRGPVRGDQGRLSGVQGVHRERPLRHGGRPLHGTERLAVRAVHRVPRPWSLWSAQLELRPDEGVALRACGPMQDRGGLRIRGWILCAAVRACAGRVKCDDRLRGRPFVARTRRAGALRDTVPVTRPTPFTGSRRVRACLIDTAHGSVVVYALAALYYLYLKADASPPPHVAEAALAPVVDFIAMVGYALLSIVAGVYFGPGVLAVGMHAVGTTPGLSRTDLALVDAVTGRRPNLFQVIVREFVDRPLALLPFGLGLVAIGIGGRGLHDVLSRTMIIAWSGPSADRVATDLGRPAKEAAALEQSLAAIQASVEQARRDDVFPGRPKPTGQFRLRRVSEPDGFDWTRLALLAAACVVAGLAASGALTRCGTEPEPVDPSIEQSQQLARWLRQPRTIPDDRMDDVVRLIAPSGPRHDDYHPSYDAMLWQHLAARTPMPDLIAYWQDEPDVMLSLFAETIGPFRVRRLDDESRRALGTLVSTAPGSQWADRVRALLRHE